VARPGDAVVVESPCFYVALQVLERLGIKAIEVPTDPRDGVDLSALARVLEVHRPKACWLMTNFQNPLGCSLPLDKKRALVDLLASHDMPLIEDDVYGELHHDGEPPSSAKSFDRRGLVMHCGSFSKSLAPGYRVGWVAAGRFAEHLRRLKLTTILSGSIPAQVAVAEYLQHGGFDHHLRRLQAALKAQKLALVEAVTRHFPPGTRLTRPDGGYFVWVDMPWDAVDALTLQKTGAGGAYQHRTRSHVLQPRRIPPLPAAEFWPSLESGRRACVGDPGPARRWSAAARRGPVTLLQAS